MSIASTTLLFAYALLATNMDNAVPPIAISPFPQEDDTLPTLTAKLSSYLYVLHIGYSMAAATGSVHRRCNTAQIGAIAISAMRPHEKDYYAA